MRIKEERKLKKRNYKLSLMREKEAGDSNDSSSISEKEDGEWSKNANKGNRKRKSRNQEDYVEECYT